MNDLNKNGESIGKLTRILANGWLQYAAVLRFPLRVLHQQKTVGGVTLSPFRLAACPISEVHGLVKSGSTV